MTPATIRPRQTDPEEEQSVGVSLYEVTTGFAGWWWWWQPNRRREKDGHKLRRGLSGIQDGGPMPMRC